MLQRFHPFEGLFQEQRKTMRSLKISVLLLVVSLFVSSTPYADQVRTIDFQGIERHYAVYPAAAPKASPSALIVFLHGYRKKEEALAARSDPVSKKIRERHPGRRTPARRCRLYLCHGRATCLRGYG